MRLRPALAALAVGAALLLAACAGGGEPGPSPTTPGTPTAPPGATLSPPPTVPGTPGTVVPPPSKPPTLQPPPTSRTGEVTLTGELVSGVEAGCRLLETDTGDYLLLGEAVQDLRLGTTVTVRGQVEPGMATICQQGTPFLVSEIVG